MSKRVGPAAAAIVLATLLLGGQATADHLRALVSVTATADASAAVGYVLAAQVGMSNGKPVGDAKIRFYDVVELFGEREMLIGAATTDASGRATLAYLPATTGKREIIALFPGADHVAPVRGRISLDATVAAPPYHLEPSGLALFSTRVPYVVGVVVLAVWALIAYAFISTARGVKSGARIRKGETA